MTHNSGDAHSPKPWLDPPLARRVVVVVAYLAAWAGAVYLGVTIASSPDYPIDHLQLAGTEVRANAVRGAEPVAFTQGLIRGDFIFIIAYSTLIAFGLRYLAVPAIRWIHVHRVVRFFGWLLVVCVALDIAENAAMLLGLEEGAGDTPWVVARIAAAVKFVAFFDLVAYVLVALGGFLIRPATVRPEPGR